MRLGKERFACVHAPAALVKIEHPYTILLGWGGGFEQRCNGG